MKVAVHSKINSIFSHIDNRMHKMDISQEINNLIRMLEDKKKMNKRVEDEIHAETSRILAYCKKKSDLRINRDRNDLIYGSYFKEGGIRQILLSLDEVVQYRLDEYVQPEILVAAVYTSRLEIARYLLGKLENQLLNLNEAHNNDINGVQIYKTIGLTDFKEDIMKVERGLKKIILEFRNDLEGKANDIEQKLRHISADIEVINPKKNIELLHRYLKNMDEEGCNETQNEYTELLEQLKGVLNNPFINKLRNMDGMDMDNYKELALKIGNIIHDNILIRW